MSTLNIIQGVLVREHIEKTYAHFTAFKADSANLNV